jgi:ElaB/YqjD/DUF883 family membrane-anchored ribosome-binding protein
MSDLSNGTTTSTVQEDLDKTLASLRAAAKDIMDLGQHRVAAAKDKVVGSGMALFESARHLIAANPFAAIGIAFGVGFIAMRLLRRRSI